MKLDWALDLMSLSRREAIGSQAGGKLRDRKTGEDWRFLCVFCGLSSSQCVRSQFLLLAFVVQDFSSQGSVIEVSVDDVLKCV